MKESKNGEFSWGNTLNEWRRLLTKTMIKQ